MSASMNTFERRIQAICQKDSRYTAAAYTFMTRALDFAVMPPDSDVKKEPHPVTGQELSKAAATYACHEWGAAARGVLASFGITSTSDFGSIVYNMIDAKIFSQNEGDRREDFDDVYDWDDVFSQTFDPHSEAGMKAMQKLYAGKNPYMMPRKRSH